MDSKNRISCYTYGIFFLLLACLAVSIISYLKISSLEAWQYTSDIFSYDQFLNELVHSGSGVDFTWGNLLGDHAYFFLFLLLPFKFFLQDKHIYFLLLLNPFLFLSSALLLFTFLSRIKKGSIGFITSSAYLVGFGCIYRGLAEDIYGFHPDISAGFLLLGATLSFLIQDTRKSSKQNWKFIGILLSIIFMITKEEMALLGLVFFLILYYLTRDKLHLALGILSATVAAIGFAIIKLSRTPYNRTNVALFGNFINQIKKNGLLFLVYHPQDPQSWLMLYWVTILGSLFLFNLIWIKRKEIRPLLVALFYTGIAKLLLSLLLFDFDLTSWHNLPGLVMILSSLLIIFAEGENQSDQAFSWKLVGILVFSSLLFLSFDAKFLLQRYQDNKNRREFVDKYVPQLEKMSVKIPKDRIVSIPMFSAIEFIQQRFSFYPAGVFSQPIGIADYAVIPYKVSHIYTGNFENLYPLSTQNGQFVQIFKTKNFILFKRVSITESDKQARKDFFTDVGLTNLIPLPEK